MQAHFRQTCCLLMVLGKCRTKFPGLRGVIAEDLCTVDKLTPENAYSRIEARRVSPQGHASRGVDTQAEKHAALASHVETDLNAFQCLGKRTGARTVRSNGTAKRVVR
jgi:hypothetical protein